MLVRWKKIQEEKESKKNIAIMLDLEGTIDGIDDEKASRLIRQVEEIRRRMDAEEAILMISTHYNNPTKMKKPLEILSRNLVRGVRIGTSFYYGGTYDYNEQQEERKGIGFNFDKIRTFEAYYVKKDNVWFALIDDGLEEDTYKKYQNHHPMLQCRPSQRRKETQNDNFMSLSTTTRGFAGVLELLDRYLESTKKMTKSEILERQRNQSISSSPKEERVTDVYPFLYRYLEEDEASEKDYKQMLFWLEYRISQRYNSKEELEWMQKTVQLLIQKLEGNKNCEKEKSLKALQKSISKKIQKIS